ncbi:thioredoxin domain-containing protein [Streptomyces sp. BG9H]|uniref:Thioredoxin domain-containing protein n=1 Tax=Streptomyces anatolicus TaxID=2675858 RepID=A0ABS6YWM6_9ACTN|nr:thioredoxin domain-containing protein [Streptomyces anatolicus]MBW5425830.1 thioredoxin domain-containing protein [Streptomyces anatolicus]
MAVHKAGRKAVRVATAVVAAALIGVAASACGPDDNGDGGGAGKSSSSAPESSSSAPDSKGPDSKGPASMGPASVKGGVITVGDPKAKHTVKVYEDSRCPFCKKFEEGGAQALVGPVAEGKVKVEYVIASFLDKNLGGSGSVNAANALRASVEAGKFPQYHAAVFASQPEEESHDAYTPAFLLKIADKVDGLRSGTFDKAVTKGTYKKWVGEAMSTFTDDGVQATPTVLIDGEKAEGEALYDQGAFAKELKKAGIS